ncbi:MAG: 16S rRNA (cytosine(967)-C(5))-methyltransferase RsmB [Endomicrobiales bacterium]|nr:16S rRNA (cytosine(967)-C(5))-methyltransferase RsmB [Endomicrobiales bacterium]
METGIVITSRQLALNILNKYKPRLTNLSYMINSSIKKAEQSYGFIDKGFLRELMWGVVKRLNTIDWVINLLSKNAKQIKTPIRNILRMGVFQILYMSDRIPDYAAVNESVNLAHLIKQNIASKFVNAVLRELIRRKDRLPWPDINTPEGMAVRHSHPGWLTKRWVQRFGHNEALEICEADNLTPKLCIRVNTLKITRDALKAELEKEGILSNLTRYSPDGLILESNPEIERLKCHKLGCFMVQDEASQLVSHILEPKENETILDICSGKGTKTSHIAQLTNCKANITAVDNSDRQIKTSIENFRQLGVENVETLKKDAKSITGIKADRVIVDAPCSGLGTIRRKQDIKWNRTEKEILKHFPSIQKQILFHASNLVKNNGILLYCTCSTEPEENENVIEDFLKKSKCFKLVNIDFAGLPGSKEKYLRLFPHKHGLDGFFMAKMIKNGN